MKDIVSLSSRANTEWCTLIGEAKDSIKDWRFDSEDLPQCPYCIRELNL